MMQRAISISAVATLFELENELEILEFEFEFGDELELGLLDEELFEITAYARATSSATRVLSV
ncbi:hypothetical protein AGMMS50222_11000 [Endomicrobiia bacterium]|nr:hypothetical protein AGMMS49556_08800 [Endomicrobiia bacterium]GHT77530.1 hypothetical protein AGMMS50222_11000 [Endomicrobiia bacterium]